MGDLCPGGAGHICHSFHEEMQSLTDSMGMHALYNICNNVAVTGIKL